MGRLSMATCGRKPWEPTDADRRLVEKMAACGIPHEQIARVIGKDLKTIYKHCREELDTAIAKANANVAAALYQNAIKGNVSAQIFWCKTRLGWKETQVVEQPSNVQVQFVDTPKQESMAEWLKRRERDEKPS
jgi:hypothetical protein